jgi:hypothetical protein
MYGESEVRATGDSRQDCNLCCMRYRWGTRLKFWCRMGSPTAVAAISATCLLTLACYEGHLQSSKAMHGAAANAVLGAKQTQQFTCWRCVELTNS